jgi:hypothetical protein
LAELEAALEGKARGHDWSTQGGGQRGGMPASCDLPESADSCCRRSRRSRTCSPKEGAAHQNRRIDTTGVTEGDREQPFRPARERKVTKHRPDRQRGPPGPVPP